MNSDIRRTDTGIYTAEGMMAGSRAAKLATAREKQIATYEQNRKKIEVWLRSRRFRVHPGLLHAICRCVVVSQDSARGVAVSNIESKFSKTTMTPDEIMKAKTVGLVTKEEFRRAREIAAKREEDEKRKREE